MDAALPPPIAAGGLPRYDEERCQHDRCNNWAKFALHGRALCGVHCNKKTEGRTELDKSEYESFKQRHRDVREVKVKEATLSNKSAARHGRVIVVGNKLEGGATRKPQIMVSQPSFRSNFFREGFLSVFPNYKHDNTKEGFGCKELSPKAMGPIKHCMPGLPDALNLENYHQFAKVFAVDADAERNPTAAWKMQRNRGYEDATPHRHSPSAASASGNKNVPLFSVYYDLKTGEERKFSYLQCRYFYCHWYERIALKSTKFEELQRLLREGTNLQIVGYDGYAEGVTKPLFKHYEDVSRPFGHEMVLLTLLVEADRRNYPWNRFRRENPDLYRGMFVAEAGGSEGGGGGSSGGGGDDGGSGAPPAAKRQRTDDGGGAH